MDLFRHPLDTPAWEQVQAAPVRPSCRAVWTSPEEGEAGAPEHRIIHLRAVHAEAPMRLDRLGIVEGPGYHKCASGVERDAALHVRLRVAEGSTWRTLVDVELDEAPAPDEIRWLDLGGVLATGAVVEIRRCAVDGWWPSWNLAMNGLILEGEPTSAWTPPRQAFLDVPGVDLSGLPAGVEAEERGSEIRFRTPYLEVGFRLRTPGFSFLGLDDDGDGRTDRNLLSLSRSMDIVRTGVYPGGVYPVLRDKQAPYLAQGPRFELADGRRPLGFLATDFHGETTVTGNRVTYRVSLPDLGQVYELAWTIHREFLELTAVRTGERAARTWTSGAWHVATDNRVTPTTVLGAVDRRGETGLVGQAFAWSFPRHGCLRVASDGAASWRSDSIRPLDTNTLELKLAEEPTAEGDYLLPPGRHETHVTMRVGAPTLARLRAEAPAAARRAVSRHSLTALPFRPDTATYSNNGASMHVASALNDLSAIARRLGPVADAEGAHPMRYLRLSLERWLAEAPGYGSGRTCHGDHLLDDEYVHLAADALLGLARYLAASGDAEWFAANATAITAVIDRTRGRDVDGDGLVESTIRRGVSGEHQWSSAWSDVLSFGWKDAWGNAVLYEALRTLASTLPGFGEGTRAAALDDWADRLRSVYLPTFLNPETGWIAGWRSADDQLHDFAFPVLNGAATKTDLIERGRAREILERLWSEFARVGYRDFRNGIPFNLRRVPESDIGGVVFGLPLGGYLQGGASHHRAGAFVEGLYRVGLEAEGDEVLMGLLTTIADDSAFGGIGTGRDWRLWDGAPSGYEGQLAEGFSVIATAIDRYGEDPAVGAGPA